MGDIFVVPYEIPALNSVIVLLVFLFKDALNLKTTNSRFQMS